MINPLKPFTKPEYFFRPRQLCLRVRRLFQGQPPETDQVRLPWGQMIAIRPREVIGASVWWYGLFDLVVTEAIYRLLDPGETALDIGANMGQMTSLMRYRAGSEGKVHSFEPHPVLFAELAELARETPAGRHWAGAEVHPVALSDHQGEATLDPGQAWEENRGLAKLVAGRDGTNPAQAAGIRVALTTLDQVLPPEVQVGVCKIDVEGHELAVFDGAARLLAERRLRDIIFEDFDPPPSPLQQRLTSQGFTLFSLHSSLWKPLLKPVRPGKIDFAQADGMNYLATLDPARAQARFRRLGWRVLQNC